MVLEEHSRLHRSGAVSLIFTKSTTEVSHQWLLLLGGRGGGRRLRVFLQASPFSCRALLELCCTTVPLVGEAQKEPLSVIAWRLSHLEVKEQVMWDDIVGSFHEERASQTPRADHWWWLGRLGGCPRTEAALLRDCGRRQGWSKLELKGQQKVDPSS